MTELRSTANCEDNLEVDNFELVPESDKFYAIFADTPEGFYIVKCLEVTNDKFRGFYLKELNREDMDRKFYKETNEKDYFHFATVIGEILSAENIKVDHSDCVAVLKVEINDVIVNVSELE